MGKKNDEESKPSTALISCDGLGDYDWSDMAEEDEPNHALVATVKTKEHNFALMAYSSSSSGSDSEVSNESDNSTCSFKSCSDTIEILKARNETLNMEVESLKLDNLGYKVGIENVERKLQYLKECEFQYIDRINVQDNEIFVKNCEIERLKKMLEEAEQARDAALDEKDKHVIRVNKLKYSVDALDKNDHNIIECQLMRKGSGIGYKDVSPPPMMSYAPVGKQLSFLAEG